MPNNRTIGGGQFPCEVSTVGRRSIDPLNKRLDSGVTLEPWLKAAGQSRAADLDITFSDFMRLLLLSELDDKNRHEYKKRLRINPVKTE